MATEMFIVREAESGIEISSSLTGAIQEHNIMGFSTLHVLWSSASEDEVGIQYLEFILHICDAYHQLEKEWNDNRKAFWRATVLQSLALVCLNRAGAKLCRTEVSLSVTFTLLFCSEAFFLS